jgi:hypothetical protein
MKKALCIFIRPEAGGRKREASGFVPNGESLKLKSQNHLNAFDRYAKLPVLKKINIFNYTCDLSLTFLPSHKKENESFDY